MAATVENLAHDLRFAVRSLARRPGFTAVAALTLMLGIGANGTVLSVAHGLLWRPLPFAESERAMLVWRATDRAGRSYLSIPTARDIASRNRVFAATAMFRAVYQNLTGSGGDPERLRILAVSHPLLEVLGVRPLAGRGFSPDDDRVGAERTIMISHQLWTRRYGADPGLVGRTVVLDDVRYTVIGILPPGVSSEQLGGLPLGDVWMPIGLFFDQLPVEDRANRPGLFVAARLAPGESRERAKQDLERIGRELAAEYPEIFAKSSLSPTPLREAVLGDVGPAVLLLQATAGLLFLIVCANLAHLFLVRTLSRRGELATRWALGASPRRLVGLLITEVLLLVALGGALGWLASYGLRGALSGFLGPAVSLDPATGGPLLVYIAAVSVLAIVIVAPAPAIRGWRLRQAADLGLRGSTAQDRFRNTLLATEVALATMLTIGSALMLESFSRLRSSDLGFETSDVLSLQISLPMPKYQESWAWVGFFDQLHERLRQLEGVRAVGMTSQLPLVSRASKSIVVAGDRDIPPVSEMASTRFETVSSGYFRAMGIALRHGRTFDSGDDDGAGANPVVIVNRALARLFWPADDATAVGRRLAFEFKGTPAAPEPQWRTIVGVVGDTRNVSPKDPPGPAVYVAYTQPSLWFVGNWPTMILVLDTAREASGVADQVRARMREIDPQQPFHDVQTLAQVLDRHLGRPRLVSALLTVFALLALTLGTVGVYGVVAFTVASGRREIGLRQALGASPRRVLRDLLRRHLLWIGLGLAGGIAASLALAPLIATELYGVKPLEPRIFAAVTFFLGSVASAASWVACREAARIHPAAALREE